MTKLSEAIKALSEAEAMNYLVYSNEQDLGKQTVLCETQRRLQSVKQHLLQLKNELTNASS